MYRRIYVQVVSEVNAQGAAKPLSITWADGRVFEIDRVTDVRKAAAEKVGGFGVRYTCRICGHQAYLFQDGQRWFVEAKD